MTVDSYLAPCTELKDKWIKDFQLKPDTKNQIEEKVGTSLEHIGTVEILLYRTPIA